MEKLTYKLTSMLYKNQIEFIKNSLSDSFPDAKVTFKKYQIECEMAEVDNFSEIKHAIMRLIFISKSVGRGKILFEQKKCPKYSLDPMVDLKQKNEVVEISEGLFQFQGEFLEIFKSANSAIYDIAKNDFQAIEQESPVLWPIELFRKIDYFDEFPHEALLVSGISKEFKKLDRFSKKYGSDKQYDKIKMEEQFFEPSKYGLQPAVCDTCYYGLRGKANVKNSVFTTYNKVFRNEFSSSGSLDRLPTFSVRDIMFVGSNKFVLSTRQLLIDRLTIFFKETALDFTIEVADDPFFTNNFEKKMFQHSFELKYEILARIPFLDKKIAVGSINLHLDTFGKALAISQGDDIVHSGCIGIGFERLLLALYSQHGPETSLWPNSTKTLLGLS